MREVDALRPQITMVEDDTEPIGDDCVSGYATGGLKSLRQNREN